MRQHTRSPDGRANEMGVCAAKTSIRVASDAFRRNADDSCIITEEK